MGPSVVGAAAVAVVVAGAAVGRFWLFNFCCYFVEETKMMAEFV